MNAAGSAGDWMSDDATQTLIDLLARHHATARQLFRVAALCEQASETDTSFLVPALKAQRYAEVMTSASVDELPATLDEYARLLRARRDVRARRNWQRWRDWLADARHIGSGE
jgi:hypothetical protein